MPTAGPAVLRGTGVCWRITSLLERTALGIGIFVTLVRLGTPRKAVVVF